MRFHLQKSIGLRGVNAPSDVAIVQDLFNRQASISALLLAGAPMAVDTMAMSTPATRWQRESAAPGMSRFSDAETSNRSIFGEGPQVRQLRPLPVDGLVSAELITRISDFQRVVMRTAQVDSLLNAQGPTFKRLYQQALPTVSTDLFGSTSARMSNALDVAEVARLAEAQYGSSHIQSFQALLGAIVADATIADVRWAAYMLATTKHETAHTFDPIREFGWNHRTHPDKKYWDEVTVTDKFGKPKKNVYYGRGFVQLTFDYNYRNLGQALGLGDDLLIDPDKVMEFDIAYNIMSYGMRNGSFTERGRSLSRFINDADCDYVDARRIINGLDKAELIASYAEAFEVMLRVGLR